MTKTASYEPHWLLPTFINLMSGGIAGCVSKTAVAPLDRVKILFQTRNEHYLSSIQSSFGVFKTIARIKREEGISHLWKGNTATLWRVFPYASIQFVSYEIFKKRIPRADHSPQNIGFKPFYHLVCGSSAGCVATIFTYPLDMIRARMASQVHRNVYRNSWHGLTVMKREEGYRSWFKGMRTTIQGIIPYAGVNFSTFETLKFFAPKNENGDLPTFWKLVCGGIAGPVGQTVSYPWDLVRRRQQTWGFAPGTEDVGKIGTCASFRKIVRMEGFFGLWRGISINYLKATPTVAIAFTVYETIQSNLQFVLL
eukprot:TRINITY_DN13725_c0_g1_i2.p1 TRINITY_DN13725_c0_g1~~TRINITY_DN13725_c0_g1_i2.p1  ORF type:complete len:310 (-),score=56.15 TRINITY_DN13725_c0_g1_i2:37-966(-)